MDRHFPLQLEAAKKIFGQRLREIRRNKYDNQTELSKQLGLELHVGGKALISRWENGHELPSGKQLFGLHKLLGVSLDYLFGITDKNAELTPPIANDPLFRYLWTENETEHIETHSRVVWVATHNFYWNYESLKWSEILLKNITEKRIKNYYLYHKTPDNDKKVKFLTDNFQRYVADEWRNFVHFVGSPADEYPCWSEYVLYDPFGENPRCIMVLPHGYGQANIGGYNLEFTLPMKNDFATWFQIVWNKNLAVEDTDWTIP